MTSEADEASTAGVYKLSCTGCDYETTVEGTQFDALDVADVHQEEHGDHPMEHFVQLELRK